MQFTSSLNLKEGVQKFNKSGLFHIDESYSGETSRGQCRVLKWKESAKALCFYALYF